MRVVMYVQNDVTHDSRVLREAASLAGAGHAVTIIGTASDPAQPDGSREERDGFAIVRVAIPTRPAWWPTFVRAPWQSIGSAAGTAARAVRSGPRAWPMALAALGGMLAALPWLVVRAGWVSIVNRLLRRPVRMRWVEYLRRWRVETLGWCRAAVTHAPAADVHHAHDLEALPAARAAARRDGSRYVYDSHEVFMGLERVLDQPWPIRGFLGQWERWMARRAAALVTINGAVADTLRRRLGVSGVSVVHNCPARWTPPLEPSDLLRRAAGIPPGAPIVLCHGSFMPNRGLEQTAEAMLQPGLEAAHLVFLGYRATFIEAILGDGRLAGRVHYVPAVDPHDVTAWVAGADVDVMAIIPVGLNSRLSTPNKLFESIAAGVPVVSTDLPIRRRIVLDDPDGPLGMLCDPSDPASIAAAIRQVVGLDPDARREWRARILRAAHARWNWERESARLIALYEELGSPG